MPQNAPFCYRRLRAVQNEHPRANIRAGQALRGVIEFRRITISSRSEVHFMADPQASGIESAMQEHRVFPPAPNFAKDARIKSLDEYRKLYQESIDSPDQFWARIAEELHWFKKWDRVLEWNC